MSKMATNDGNCNNKVIESSAGENLYCLFKSLLLDG